MPIRLVYCLAWFEIISMHPHWYPEGMIQGVVEILGRAGEVEIYNWDELEM